MMPSKVLLKTCVDFNLTTTTVPVAHTCVTINIAAIIERTLCVQKVAIHPVDWCIRTPVTICITNKFAPHDA